LIADGLPTAKADPHQLQQVLVNLLLNGRDSLADSGSLTVAARVDREQLRIDVVDNGAGIAPEHIRYIFDPFFTTKPPGKGTGLGLAISARIIEGFGGRITVVSGPETGTCFTLWLPLAEGEGK
jgi:signal transduction histidine kinase